MHIDTELDAMLEMHRQRLHMRLKMHFYTKFKEVCEKVSTVQALQEQANKTEEWQKVSFSTSTLTP